LRAVNRSKQVFALSLLDAGVSISLLLFMVIYLQRGSRGYIEAAALSQAANLILMLLIVASRLKFSIQTDSLKHLVKMGLPCIYGYFGYCILQGSSRYNLQFFDTESEVGFYFLGSNIGKIIELPLWGFMSAWVPFFNSYLYRQKEAPPLFSKMMTYYLLTMGCLCAAMFCFARPVVELLMQPSFHDVWKVAGLSSIAQALWGAYAITCPALIFHKRTGTQACLELGAAGICIAANILLVPFFGKEGAAIATAAGFISLNLMSVKVNQRLMFIPYETKRLVKIISALFCTALLSFAPIPQLVLYSFFMCINIGSFYFFCWKSVLDDEEKGKITRILFPRLSRGYS
jgi:O-antigen/teichoic acid export membrane protein